MKLSLNWLKKYIDPKLSMDALIERLTMAGLEVEAVESVGGDTVLEIEITPNRPDCLNFLGLAREIGAITGKPVKSPKISNFNAPALKKLVSIEDKKDCSCYIGTLMNEVHVLESPQELKKCLTSVGIKTVNNAVDITNFVMMEGGQPLHAFDYDKLIGDKIFVRRAKAGESIVTLDGVERKLDPTILVIADAKRPVAIAGIMGGRDTQITAHTRNILLESAHFDMGLVRRASRSLGLRSDSSYRFERNVNIEGVLPAANRATELLLQLTEGRLIGRGSILTKAKSAAKSISLKTADIESLLGLTVTASKVKTWLSRLGFKVSVKAEMLIVTPPVNRADIQQEVDVIEEIARMVGFDHLPSKMPVIKSANIPVDKNPRAIKDQIRRSLTAAGLNEIITHAMINSKSMSKCNLGDMPVMRIYNPLTQDQELMRPILLPSLLQVVVTNFNRGQKDLRFFEIGKTYFKSGERETAAVLLTGRRSHDWRSSKKDMVAIFDLKGVLENIFQSIGANASFESAPVPAFDPSCAATIIIEGKQIGVLGKLEQKVLSNWDIKNQDVYYAEFFLDAVFLHSGKIKKYQPISEYPAIMRDVSLAVKKDVPYKKIEEICFKQGGDILRSVQFIEQYLGDKIPAGQKGLVFSCQYQSNTGTLREDQVTAVHERILQALTNDLGAVRR